MSEWKWLEKHRLHESAEVKTRNLVTRAQVIKAVIFQQAIQTLLGVFWMTDHGNMVDHSTEMQKLAVGMAKVLSLFMDGKTVQRLLDVAGGEFAYYAYWWFIPVAQFLFAAYVSVLLPTCAVERF